MKQHSLVLLCLVCGVFASPATALGLPLYHVYVDGGQGIAEASSNINVSRASNFEGGGDAIDAFAAADSYGLRTAPPPKSPP